MKGSVLVVGAGVAGMRAATELLRQGFKVYLLEQRRDIGGKMATIDRWFPTDEHGACSLQPLTLELVHDPNATILTPAELLSLRGVPGDFTVEVSRAEAGGTAGPRTLELAVGAVIVAPEPEADNPEPTRVLAARLGLEVDEKGYFRKPDNGHPVLTFRDGVFVSDTTQGPQGIAELVVRACAAAAHAAALLAPARGRELVEPAVKNLFPVKVTDEPAIAVVIDQGGAEVAELLDLDELAEYTRTLFAVAAVAVTPCAFDGAKIRELVATGDFNRLVVAGPSPVPHEPRFQRLAEEAGLNRFLVEMVNLHNQCARVHARDKTAATEKAKTLMTMGVVRARRLEPLEELKVKVTPSCLVVGASPSGVACAAKLAAMGLRVHLVESVPDPEGIPGNDHPLVAPSVAGLLADRLVEVHAPATVGGVQGHLGAFTVELVRQGKKDTLEVGTIVVATGKGTEEGPLSSRFEGSLALAKDEEGFYLSTQGILNLLDFVTEGVFNCGPARAALTPEDALVDGEAAASRAACILTSTVIARPPTISDVVEENCDGCAYCVEPCPTRSITLLEFMQRQALRKIVEVNEATCIGCGICMATCPKDGIVVKHFKTATFSEMVRAALGGNASDQPVIVNFCCNRCAYPGADAAGVAGLQYPAGVRTIRVVCAGMIHPNVIMDALTRGAGGVLLCGCHPGNCRSREGIRKAQARAEGIELLLEDYGLEPERFRLELIAASEGAKFARVVAEMTEELSALGPNPYRQNR